MIGAETPPTTPIRVAKEKTLVNPNITITVEGAMQHRTEYRANAAQWTNHLNKRAGASDGNRQGHGGHKGSAGREKGEQKSEGGKGQDKEMEGRMDENHCVRREGYAGKTFRGEGPTQP